MGFSLLRFFCLLFTLTVSSSCSNVLERFADVNTDAANYEEAQKKLNGGEYSEAEFYFSKLSPAFASNPEVKLQWASALAGQCGYTFFSIFGSLGSGDPLFLSAMKAFQQKSYSLDKCTAARLKLEEISSDPALRSVDQNLFMLVLGFARIGGALRNDADIDSIGNLGDGAMDGGFNACTVGAGNNADGELSDAEIDEVILGLGLVLQNLTFVSAAIGGGADSITEISDACGALTPVPLPVNPCTITDSSQITGAVRTAIRQIVHTNNTNPTMPLGIGGCNNADVTTCCGL